MARSVRRFWRLLDQVDAVSAASDPHPLAMVFAVAARLRRKRVVLACVRSFPSHMRTRHPRRYDIRGAAQSRGDLARPGRLFPMVAVGPDLARRYRGGETADDLACG